MITWDRIGDCPGTPAFLVEGYSPKDGRAHGSLDVTVRACTACHEEVFLQISRCGLTPFSMPIPQIGKRACGDRTTFAQNPYTTTHR